MHTGHLEEVKGDMSPQQGASRRGAWAHPGTSLMREGPVTRASAGHFNKWKPHSHRLAGSQQRNLNSVPRAREAIKASMQRRCMASFLAAVGKWSHSTEYREPTGRQLQELKANFDLGMGYSSRNEKAFQRPIPGDLKTDQAQEGRQRNEGRQTPPCDQDRREAAIWACGRGGEWGLS